MAIRSTDLILFYNTSLFCFAASLIDSFAEFVTKVVNCCGWSFETEYLIREHFHIFDIFPQDRSVYWISLKNKIGFILMFIFKILPWKSKSIEASVRAAHCFLVTYYITLVLPLGDLSTVSRIIDYFEWHMKLLQSIIIELENNDNENFKL